MQFLSLSEQLTRSACLSKIKEKYNCLIKAFVLELKSHEFAHILMINGSFGKLGT